MMDKFCCAEKAPAMAFQVGITREPSIILQIHQLKTWLEPYRNSYLIDPWAAVAASLHKHIPYTYMYVGINM